MKREIKFRAFIKNEIGGFMIPSEDSDCFMVSNGNGFVVYDENKNTLEDSEFEIMQFTGLKDKEGKEIYEGDVLQDEFGSSGLVFWNKDDASFSIEYKDIECQAFLNVEDWSEVIGNIYENPELLTN